ncbi:MAG: hypothetical protein AB8H80_03080 [Planctomycetota bacterium]
MNSLAHLVLLGSVPLGAGLFAFLSARVAALIVLLAGMLFLPILTIPLPGPVSLGKAEAISLALLLGVLAFDSGAIQRFRPCFGDVLFVGAMIAGGIASLTNNVGPYDAFATTLNRCIRLGIPYLIGAVYLSTKIGRRELLWGVFLAGLAYVPFCLYELRMSPQLHRIFYGAGQHAFDQTSRGGGWRPMVFMQHGLELALFMAAAFLAGLALFDSGQRKLFGQRLVLAVAGLGAVVVACKSTGALLLAMVGFAATRRPFRSWVPAGLLLLVPIYLVARIVSGGVLEEMLIEYSRSLSEERALSLGFRLDNEVILLEKLWRTPIFGAGGWNFSNVINPETGEMEVIVTDSFWIIALATTGLFGMISTYGMLWVPAFRSSLQHLRAAGEDRALWTGCTSILLILAFDLLVNGFLPAIYVAMAAGLIRGSRAEAERRVVVRRVLQPRPRLERMPST